MYKKTRLWHCLALAFPLTLALFPAISYAACNAGDVGGAAYLELPVAPGGTTANVYGQREANEPGLAGISVNVTDSMGKVQSVTTDIDGKWSVAAPAFPVRVEFTWAQSWLKSSVNGAGNNTSVQFVNVTDCNTNFGAQNPDDYSSTANPVYITNLQQNGSGVGNANPSIQNVHYADTGLSAAFSDYNGDAGTGPIPSSSAAVEQVGSTWGKAFQKNTQRLFASAALQRHIGFSSTGDAGSVYVLDYAAGMPGTLLGSFNLQGVTPANGGDAIDVGTVCRSAACASAAGNTGRDLDYILDAGIGTPNIDLDAFTKVGKMSFGDIDVEQTTNVLWLTNLKQKSLISVDVSGGFAALPGTVNQYLITSLPGAPSCTGGELRPWALSMHQGRGYLGAVCDALASQNAADMTAYVLSFDAAKPADGFNTEISFPLNYDKNGADWNPWSDTDKSVGANWKSYIQPILSDIEFDENNNMYLAFFDRYGLQAGFYNFVPTPGVTDLYASSSNWEKTQSLGEILKVCHATDGFALEGTATCPASHYGSEFFNDLAGDGSPEGSSGAVALLKGSQQLLLSLVDPHPETGTGTAYWSTQGTNTLSTTTGAIDNWYTNVTSMDQANGYNGKSHSMGDIELLTDAAPVEVGNRVWLDTNRNGIQDAGEAGIDGVQVKLVCGADEATATTANGGVFTFSNATGGNATFMGYGESCTLKVDNAQTALKDYSLTTQNADGVTDNNAQTDLRDSDATDNAGTADIAFTVGNAGENNHTLDIGYKQVQTDIALTKTLDKTSVKPGETVVYTLTVTNESATDATGVVVTEKLPAGVTWVADDSVGTYVKETGIWTIGTVGKSTSKILKITVTIN